MGRLTTFPGNIVKGWRLLSVRAAALLLVVLMCSGGLYAYSVLTHEQIVDLAWTDQIRSLLLKRYPNLSEDQIREAHAHAYGGARHPGSRLLPIRQQGVQQPGALRPQRRLRCGASARKPGCERIRLRPGRPLALCGGHCRPP